MSSCDNTVALKPGTVEMAQPLEIANEFPGTANEIARRRCARGRDPIMDECPGVRGRANINLADHGNSRRR